MQQLRENLVKALLFSLGALFVVPLAMPLKSSAAEECEKPADAVTHLGKFYNTSRHFKQGKNILSPEDIDIDKLRYVRLFLEPSSKEPWHLTVRSQDFRPIDILFSDGNSTHKSVTWTRRLEIGTKLIFDLEAPDGFSLDASALVAMPNEAETPYYSIYSGGDQKMDKIETAPSEYRRRGDAVGFLMARKGASSWCCSVFAVSSDTVLTNWHCGGHPETADPRSFWTPSICRNTIIDMSWDGDSIDREYVCQKVLASDQILDYALLKVAPMRRVDRLKPAVIRRSPAGDGETLTMVHHPACAAKHVSYACSVTDPNIANWRDATDSQTGFSHNCNTEAGSSGGAIFDSSGSIVGMHHLGFEKKGGVCDRRNKGVHINEILKHLAPKTRTSLNLKLPD